MSLPAIRHVINVCALLLLQPMLVWAEQDIPYSGAPDTATPFLALHYVPVTVVPKNANSHYNVNIHEQSCNTPCTLDVVSGPALVNVLTSGGSAFKRDIVIPANPSTLTIRQLTVGHMAAGVSLTTIGIAAISIGSVYLSHMYYYYDGFGGSYLQQDRGSTSIGGVLVGIGGATAIAGIVNLALTRGNSVEVGTSAQHAGRFRLKSGAVAPSSDRTGLLASLRFDF